MFTLPRLSTYALRLLPLAVTAMALTAHAAPVVLADSPALDTNVVKPNLMFTLDTSGSMAWTGVPDSIRDTQAEKDRACFKNHIFNPLYFNPGVTYSPPNSYNAATNTTTTLPDVPYTAAPWDGFNVPVAGVGGATYRDNIAPLNGATWGNRTALLDLTTRFRPDYEYNSGYQPTPQVPTGGYYMQYVPSVGGSPAVPVDGVCYTTVGSYVQVNVNTQPAVVQQNFANWFSYYRTRMQAMKSAAGIAFASLDDGFRVGFHDIWNVAGSFLNVNDFTGAHRQSWFTRFYAQVPNNGTPLRTASVRIGEYFRSPLTSGLPGAVDPIQYSCQGNYHILSTDGYWNDGAEPVFPPAGAAAGTTDGDVDDVVPPLPAPVAGLTAGSPWPRPYLQNTAAPVAPAISKKTLSDIASYYWATDLRPTLANNVPTGPRDPASWQHVVFFGVSIAAQGTLPYNPNNPAVAAQTIADIVAGTRVWPHPAPSGANTATTIDDLWHATVNGRGQFFNVSSPQQLSSALSAALQDISSRSASGAGGALAESGLSAGSDNLIYTPSYTSGDWTGELKAERLDATTAQVASIAWKHADKLDAQLAGAGWNTGRRVLTWSGAVPAPFRVASLSAAQLATLGSTAARQQAVLNYIRGDASNEVVTAGSLQFRPRPKRLGDIVNSEPVAVAAPNEIYAENFNPGYGAFKIAKASRTPMVYFGANDGLLHAVNGEATGVNAGNEVWAYLPGPLLRAGASGIAALTYKQTDPLPNKYSHRFYVDATPNVRDVDFARTSQSASSPTPNPGLPPDWRTVLVTGLGKGGNSYVALDITTPPTSGETEASLAASGRVLWEFTEPDMGFTYGKPVLTKTVRYGWVAILAGGYNNITGPNPGKGIVYVVDIKTGTLLHKFITPDGSAANPLGLAFINSFNPDARDRTVSEVYGGDLYGNLWRVDLTSADPYTAPPIKFALLRDSAGVAQPVTTYPTPYADPVSGIRFVAIGTGKLFTPTDLPDTSQQTLWNFRDGNVNVPRTTGLPVVRSNMGAILRTTQLSGLPSYNEGWYQDLQPNGERIVKPATSLLGIIIAISITPSTDPCFRGGIGTAYARVGLSGDNSLGSSATFYGGTADSVQITGINKVTTSAPVPCTGAGCPVPPPPPPCAALGTCPPDPCAGASGGKKTLALLTLSDGTSSNIQPNVCNAFKGNVVNYREIIE